MRSSYFHFIHWSTSPSFFNLRGNNDREGFMPIFCQNESFYAFSFQNVPPGGVGGVGLLYVLYIKRGIISIIYCTRKKNLCISSKTYWNAVMYVKRITIIVNSY